LSIRGWDAKADSTGKVGLDRSWLVGITINEPHSNGQEIRLDPWWRALIRGMREPYEAPPPVECRLGTPFLGAELGD
jgi:hypothetical protein